MRLVRNAGEHSYDPMVNGVRHCALCLIAEPLLVGQFQCSGVRGMFGRPVFAQDLTGRDDARLSEASVAIATTVNAPTGSPPAAPRPVKKRRGISPASPAQREAVRGRACIVTKDDRGVDPAHLLSRSFCSIGQDDPRAVVPLRRDQHRLFDTGQLDLLPYLEPHYRVELAYAVERVGLLATLRQVTGRRWTEDAA